MSQGRGFWREPVAWVVVGLPAASVAALGVTIALAVREPVDSTANRTQRIAQIQLEDLAADREAARLGLHTRLHADAATGVIELALEPGDAPAGTLRLAMRHPSREDLDRIVVLAREGDRWRGQAGPWPSKQGWNLQLVPDPPAWRLTGRLDAGTADAELSAAVAR
jgi:hypothetical protein